MAKEGNRLMASNGFISYTCRPVEPVRPVAFTSEESHVVSVLLYLQNEYKSPTIIKVDKVNPSYTP